MQLVTWICPCSSLLCPFPVIGMIFWDILKRMDDILSLFFQGLVNWDVYLFLGLLAIRFSVKIIFLAPVHPTFEILSTFLCDPNTGGGHILGSCHWMFCHTYNSCFSLFCLCNIRNIFVFFDVFSDSAAALKVLSYLPLPYTALSLFLIIPRPLRDAVYDYVAKRRYDWFGKSGDCLVLQEKELLERFIDRDEMMSRNWSDLFYTSLMQSALFSFQLTRLSCFDIMKMISGWINVNSWYCRYTTQKLRYYRQL